MNLINRYSIIVRLTIGFSFLMVICVLIAYIGLWRLHLVAAAASEMMAKPLEKERVISDWSTGLSGGALRTIAIAKSKDIGLADYFKESSKIGAQNVSNLQKKTEALLSSADEKARFAAIDEARRVYLKTRDEITYLKSQGNIAEADKLFDNSFTPALKTYQGEVGKLLDLQRREINRLSDEVQVTYKQSVWLLGIIVFSAMLGSIAITLVVAKSIRIPLNETVQIMEQIAKGDLSVRIEVTSAQQHELARLKNSAATMVNALSQLINTLRLKSGDLNTASSSLFASVSEVEQRNSAQTGATQSMAASLEELTVSISQVSRLSADAQQFCEQVGKTSAEGTRVIQDMASEVKCISKTITMAAATTKALSEESEKISSITNVIKDISGQTNLLALNAAIEAARAGEQGRGFAVVADEVRKLAEMANNSAEEISAMVFSIQSSTQEVLGQMNTSVERVNLGVALALEAESSVISIRNEAENMLNVITSVSSALDEQCAASADVATRVEEIVQMVEGTSRAMGSVDNISHLVGATAETLHQEVSRFQ